MVNHFLPLHMSDSMKHMRISAQLTSEKKKRSCAHVEFVGFCLFVAFMLIIVMSWFDACTMDRDGSCASVRQGRTLR